MIDDASEDSPEEMVNLIKDKRIKYFRHDVIKGEAGSRNTGIINAKGKFIAFLDDDDEWLPEKLSLQLELLEKGSPKIGVVYTGRQCLNLSDKKIIGITNPSKKGDIYYDMLRENVIGTPSSVLVKKECIEKIGLFDENLAYFVDYDFF